MRANSERKHPGGTEGVLDINHKIHVFIVVVYGIPFILAKNIIVCIMIIIN